MHSFAPSVRRAQAPSTALRSGGSRSGAPPSVYELASIRAFPSTRGYAMEADETRKPPPEEEEQTRASLGQGAKASPAEAAPDETAPPPAPAPPAPAPPQPACTITSTTTLSAPDSTADTRSTVGVLEEGEFTVTGSADWTATSGTPTTTAATTSSFVWTAPKAADTPTITASVGTPPQPCTLALTVVEPASVSLKKVTDDTFVAGAQGVGMVCDVLFAPLSVSLAQVEWLEVGKDAVNVTGYWDKKQKAGADLTHHPNPSWIPVNSANKTGDHAATSGWPKPWEDGTYDWPIPNKFRPHGDTGDGKEFAPTTQSFAIKPDGTTSVSKGGESATRTP